MRTAINLILVTFFLMIGNIAVAFSHSNGLVALMTIISCFLNAVLMAGIISTCELRSSWIAYIVTTSLFMLLFIARSESLVGVMRNVAEMVNGWGMLPLENSTLDYYPVARLGAALEISCPPLFGVAAGFMAILFFPGRRLRKEITNEYRDLSRIHFASDVVHRVQRTPTTKI